MRNKNDSYVDIGVDIMGVNEQCDWKGLSCNQKISVNMDTIGITAITLLT
jgi:hypothetical protein